MFRVRHETVGILFIQGLTGFGKFHKCYDFSFIWYLLHFDVHYLLEDLEALLINYLAKLLHACCTQHSSLLPLFRTHAFLSPTHLSRNHFPLNFPQHRTVPSLFLKFPPLPPIFLLLRIISHLFLYSKYDILLSRTILEHPLKLLSRYHYLFDSSLIILLT